MGNKLLKIDCLSLSKKLDNETHNVYERQQSISSSPPSKSRVHPKIHTPHTQVTRSSIKVLFLDVDGVLNTINTIFDDTNNGIEDNLLQHLKLILDSTECKIVLSTTWRLHINYKHILLYILRTRAQIDIDEIIIGETTSMPNCTRSTEILRFIHAYNSNHENKHYISQFCAIDDLPLNSYPNSSFIQKHFVRTNDKIGLSMFKASECIQILNGNDDYYRRIFPKSPSGMSCIVFD